MSEHWKEADLPRVLAEVVSDCVDLFQKELRLARVELMAAAKRTLGGSAWMAVGALLGLLALVFLLEGLVFVMIDHGLPPYGACLVVTAVLAAGAIGAFFWGKSGLEQGLTPRRTMRQIEQDIRVAKEQMS
jgi:uncharacterized membrane protein YqjE